MLLTLLLLGYTQVFAHIHRDDFSALTHSKKSHHLQVPVTQASEISTDYFEEEDKRNLLKSYSGKHTILDFFYAHLSAEYYFQRLKTFSSFGANSSQRYFLTSPVFRVLRL